MHYENQILIEEMYRDRKQAMVAEFVKQDDSLKANIDLAVQATLEWIDDDHYESKNKRIQAVREMDLEKFYVGLVAAVGQAQQGKYTQIVGMVSHQVPGPKDEAIKTTGELIAIAAILELIDVVPSRLSQTGSMEVVSKFALSAEALELMSQYMYLPPMIVPPALIMSNRGSGYLTKKNDSLILKDNHHDEDICLDHLNRLNRMKFSLDTRIIRGIRDNRKHLDQPKSGESKEEYESRVASFLKMEQVSMKVFATIVNNGNSLWFTHKYDKRGRTYCQGFHASYQGNCYRKAMLELADKELITGEL